MDGEGRTERRKGEDGGAEKNKPKKAKFVCKKKKPRKEKNVSTTQFCSPPQKKSCPKEKACLGGGGGVGGSVGCLSGLRPVLRHILSWLERLWLVDVFASCWK